MNNIVDISKLLESKKEDEIYNRFYELKEKAANSLPLKKRMEFNELYTVYQMTVLTEFADKFIE